MSKTALIEWEYEDNLDFDLTKGMFLASEIVYGVRMYPYVSINNDRYYLERTK
ncbi:hypothetical protein FLK61_26085 [Paenalkalicoccus suaedae]|uniref:Uncharacterized protein n=1 Tax=Paenalkalicoccus suaedae TaxID=2592382 RepID=A0A859FAC6_9BACI|nr:hypothetical protein [Paenalkalicoccus suaedae]QKS70233.1 hypothetical protein FLK61_26085 [Paenalkalicoccus suaedae]